MVLPFFNLPRTTVLKYILVYIYTFIRIVERTVFVFFFRKLNIYIISDIAMFIEDVIKTNKLPTVPISVLNLYN